MRLPSCEPSHLYRALVEQAQDAIVLADREGLIRVWNRGAQIVFGYTAQEVLGRSLDLIIPEKFRQAHAVGYAHAVESGHTRYDGRIMTTRAQNKFGGRLYVDMSFSLVKDDAGRVVGVVAIARDVTDRYLEELARRARSNPETPKEVA